MAAAKRPQSSGDLAPIARRARSSPDLATAARPPSYPDLLPELPAPKVVPVAALQAPPLPKAAPPRATAEVKAAPSEPRSPSTLETATLTLQSLPLEVQEQLFGVLRASLDASLEPLLEKQQLLEARLDWLNQAAQRAEAMSAVPVPMPVAVPAPEASAVPAAWSIPPPAEVVASLPPVAPSIPIAVSAPPVAPVVLSIPPTVEIISTSYGPVIVPSVMPRSAFEIELANVGPIDIPDFGKGRRAAGRVFIALLFAGVAAAIAATLLSYV